MPRGTTARREITGRVTIMSQDSEREARQTEVAKVRQKEGYGTVPNVTEDETDEKTWEDEVKEAIHEFEEEKGDWSKSRG